jgi:hypothetical protein
MGESHFAPIYDSPMRASALASSEAGTSIKMMAIQVGLVHQHLEVGGRSEEDCPFARCAGIRTRGALPPAVSLPVRALSERCFDEAGPDNPSRIVSHRPASLSMVASVVWS